EPGGKWCRCEPFRHARGLTGIGHNDRPIGGDRTRLRFRQFVGIDLKAPAKLVLGGKILLQLFVGRLVRGLLCGGSREHSDHRDERERYALQSVHVGSPGLEWSSTQMSAPVCNVVAKGR